MNLVIAQRLVRRLCEDKEEYRLSPQDLERFKEYCDIEKVTKTMRESKMIPSNRTLLDVSFYKPKPNAESPDGYRGRVGIYEVLPVTETIKGLLVERASSDRIQQQAEREGMLTMIEDGLLKAIQGVTTIEEVLRVINE